MTTEQKAIELVNKFKIGDVVTEKLQIVNINIYSKLFALMAIDELIYFGNIELLSEIFEGDYYCDVDFFEAVKKEIEKL